MNIDIYYDYVNGAKSEGIDHNQTIYFDISKTKQSKR